MLASSRLAGAFMMQKPPFGGEKLLGAATFAFDGGLVFSGVLGFMVWRN
jgi:hypothetical protein